MVIERQKPLALKLRQTPYELPVIARAQRRLGDVKRFMSQSAEHETELRGDVFVEEQFRYASAPSNSIARRTRVGSIPYNAAVSSGPISRATPATK